MPASSGPRQSFWNSTLQPIRSHSPLNVAARVAQSSDPVRRDALALWWLQLGLNAAWTPVFFGARRTGGGALLITALLPAVAGTAAASARVDRRAGLLYAPYLAWSAYAAALNIEIWRRNRA